MEQAGAGLEKIVAQSLRQAPPAEAPLLAWPVVCGSAVAERTQSEAEGGRRLALAGTGVDHQKTFRDGLGGNFGVLDLLAFGHLGTVTRGLIGVDFAHDVLRYHFPGGDRITGTPSRQHPARLRKGIGGGIDSTAFPSD